MQNFQRKDIKRAHISNVLPFKISRSCILTFEEIWVIRKSITVFGNKLRSSFQYALLDYDLQNEMIQLWFKCKSTDLAGSV